MMRLLDPRECHARRSTNRTKALILIAKVERLEPSVTARRAENPSDWKMTSLKETAKSLNLMEREGLEPSTPAL